MCSYCLLAALVLHVGPPVRYSVQQEHRRSTAAYTVQRYHTLRFVFSRVGNSEPNALITFTYVRATYQLNVHRGRRMSVTVFATAHTYYC